MFIVELGLECVSQDDDFIYDCKAAYHVVLDDIRDVISSKDVLIEGGFFVFCFRSYVVLRDVSVLQCCSSPVATPAGAS